MSIIGLFNHIIFSLLKVELIIVSLSEVFFSGREAITIVTKSNIFE